MLFSDIVPGALITTVHAERGFSVFMYPTPELQLAVGALDALPFYDGVVIARMTDAESIKAAGGVRRLPIMVLCSLTMRVGWISIYDVRAA